MWFDRRGTRRATVVLVCALMVSACAEQQAKPRLTVRPVDAPATLQEAERAFQDGRFEAAESRYLEVTAVEPAHPVALLGLGETYLASGDARKAAENFAKIKEGPQAAAARQGEGIAAMRDGRAEAAVPLLQAALDKDPALWRAHNALALYHDQNGDWPEARRHFDAALAINPRAAVVHNNLGYSLLLQRSYAEAAGYLEKALSLDPELRVARNNLRFAQAWQGRYAEAIAAAPPTELRTALNDVGYVAMLRKDYEVAEAYFVRAMEASPSYFEPAARNLAQVRALKAAPAGR